MMGTGSKHVTLCPDCAGRLEKVDMWVPQVPHQQTLSMPLSAPSLSACSHLSPQGL